MSVAGYQRAKPRHAPITADTPANIIPALNALMRCANGVEAMAALGAVPQHLWPLAVKHAARRASIRSDVMQTTLMLIGKEALYRALGGREASALLRRFVPSDSL